MLARGKFGSVREWITNYSCKEITANHGHSGSVPCLYTVVLVVVFRAFSILGYYVLPLLCYCVPA